MEGILLDTVAFGFAVATLYAVIPLAAAIALLGYMAKAERTGARLLWAEWPVFETAEAPPVERKLRIAA